MIYVSSWLDRIPPLVTLTETTVRRHGISKVGGYFNSIKCESNQSEPNWNIINPLYSFINAQHGLTQASIWENSFIFKRRDTMLFFYTYSIGCTFSQNVQPPTSSCWWITMFTCELVTIVVSFGRGNQRPNDWRERCREVDSTDLFKRQLKTSL